MVDGKSQSQSQALKRGPRPVNLRLRRLLVMLPWLMERGSVSTKEMADHFGLSVKELVAELTLASLCGVSQDPLDLIDLWVDEDEVHVGIPKYFERPLRLTLPEAFTLVASANLALQIPGSDRNGALARAIEKVVAATGLEVEATVAVEIDAPALLETLAQAAIKSEIVTFAYWSVAAGDLQTRRAVPVETFREQDHWYLRAYDIEVSAERTFRVDRMESLALTGGVQKVSLGSRGQWFATSEDARLVTLRIESTWLWMLERYPHISMGPDFNSGLPFQTVRILVSNEHWLQRLLLRLGAHATVIEPPQWQDLGRNAAVGVAARYRSSQLA